MFLLKFTKKGVIWTGQNKGEKGAIHQKPLKKGADLKSESKKRAELQKSMTLKPLWGRYDRGQRFTDFFWYMGHLIRALNSLSWQNGRKKRNKLRNANNRHFSLPFFLNYDVFNRPGVARPVLQTVTESMTDPLWKYLQNTVSPKP